MMAKINELDETLSSRRSDANDESSDVSDPLDKRETSFVRADRHPDFVDEDYAPMFWSSAHAALLTIIIHFFVPAYLAMVWGATLELRLWNYVFPYFAIQTDAATFQDIIRWSVLVTCVVLGAFSLWSVIRNRRLQVQAGRSFAWLDIALLGALQLTRGYFFDSSARAATWMWIVLLVGVTGFSIINLMVWGEYRKRERVREAELELQLERERQIEEAKLAERRNLEQLNENKRKAGMEQAAAQASNGQQSTTTETPTDLVESLRH